MKTYIKSFEYIDAEYELLELEFLFNQCNYGRIEY